MIYIKVFSIGDSLACKENVPASDYPSLGKYIQLSVCHNGSTVQQHVAPYSTANSVFKISNGMHGIIEYENLELFNLNKKIVKNCIN